MDDLAVWREFVLNSVCEDLSDLFVFSNKI